MTNKEALEELYQEQEQLEEKDTGLFSNYRLQEVKKQIEELEYQEWLANT